MTTHVYKVINDAVSGGNKSKVTSSDTTANFLDEKIVSGSTKLTKTIINSGGDEDLSLDVDESQIDHGNLLAASLTDDDHAQYALLAGRATGQIIIGGTASNDTLILRSTSDATKGTVTLDETTQSTDKDTGALVVEGGVGIEKNLNVGGNVVVTGTLQVDGVTTTINTATLDVEDTNITVNNNGNDATSEGAGLTVERTGTDGSFIYEDALTSKFKIGALGSEVEIVDVSSAQTLTNKTIAAGSNTISGLTHGTEVDNPTSGVHGVTGNVVGTSDSQTLTNKTIDADNNTISNLVHGSEVDDPSSGVHGVTGSVVGTTDTQSLTNKTIDADLNTISNLAHGAEVDDPSSGVHGVTGSVVGTTDSQTLTNKTIDGDSNTISNLAHGAEVDDPTSGAHGITGSFVGDTDAQTLTNKTLDNTNTITLIDTNLTLQDNVDNTKQANFQLSTISTATTREFILPDANDTFVLLNESQTLLNKTLTSPTLTTPTINTSVSGTAILDEDDLNSDSDTQLATQQSIKAYIDSFRSTGDLPETTFATANNQAAPASITGFAFANGTVRSFKAEVSMAIDATADLFEKFEIEGIQKGADWEISYSSTGDTSGIAFDITAAGQMQYTSTNETGFVSGDMRFKAHVTGV